MSTDTSTTERAKETASTAADQGMHVASVAASEAKDVAAEAVQQARSVVGDAVGQVRGQLDDQSRQQKDRLVGTLGTFSDDLGRMADSGSGLAAGVAREVADRAQSLSRHLEFREPTDLVDDVRRFARQRPGTFLLGALAAGVVVGRLVRGTKDAVEAAEAQAPSDSQDSYESQDSLATAQGFPSPPSHLPAQPMQPAIPPAATGYSSPPPGTGLPEAPLSSPGGSTA